MSGLVYLGGGGSSQDEAQLWSEMLIGCRRLLYWPFALDAGMLAGAEAWLREQLAEHRDRPAHVEVWTSLDGRSPADLTEFDLLFVGGGNTFRLLDQLRAHGWEDELSAWVQDGGCYYGGSAGAILAADSIAIAGTLDRNDVGLTDLTGLGLVAGVAVLPHYTPEQEELARSFSREHAVWVLGVPETAGLVIDGATAGVRGTDDVWVFDATTTRPRAPGSSFPLP